MLLIIIIIHNAIYFLKDNTSIHFCDENLNKLCFCHNTKWTFHLLTWLWWSQSALGHSCAHLFRHNWGDNKGEQLYHTIFMKQICTLSFSSLTSSHTSIWHIYHLTWIVVCHPQQAVSQGHFPQAVTSNGPGSFSVIH